jgi:hypothetical protein
MSCQDGGQPSSRRPIRSSGLSTPRSASSSTAAAVNCLLTDAIWKRVRAVQPSLTASAIVSPPRRTRTEPGIVGSVDIRRP